MIKKANSQEELKAGYLYDYLSGLQVKATPEEVDAVQVFSRRLIEDYCYSKDCVQAHPQFRVRIRPSDNEKSYPIDIAVFRSSKKTEDNLFLVVECKKRNRKEGLAQLKLYLDMSPATIGVWFNGDEHEYIRKILHKNGSRTYEPLPNIPRCGQRVEDIGLYKRKDLRKPSNLKAIFRDLRNHLAGMTTGITRDEALAQEIINVLFCKILDEQETDPDTMVSFRAGVGEDPKTIQSRLLSLFERVKTATFEDVFEKQDTITLDPASLCYVVGELQNYCIMDADRDAIGDAFEVFIGPALRGAEGQFFTPRNVVKMMVEILDPKPGEKIIDPACGSGGFLITALEHVWGKLRDEGKRKNWSQRQQFKREVEVATDCFRGIDKDSFLAKVCKAYMALVGDGRGGIFCANTLLNPDEWAHTLRDKVKLGSFDVVMTNPPFGNKINIKGANTLSQYDLAYKWKRDKKTGTIEKTSTLHEDQPPQILFLERCLQLLKPGGQLGIVLPESILGNPSYEHIVSFLLQNTRIVATITMPESLFKTSGKGGTHTKVCALILKKETPKHPYSFFMAEAKWCGHDSRGNPTLRKGKSGKEVLLDDIPVITARYGSVSQDSKAPRDHLGFIINSDDIQNRILVPKYYNPEIDADLDSLRKTHSLVTVGDLVEKGTLTVTTGIEIGKMAYGTGTIPFIRTSDISNWEIKADFKHGVSRDIYEEYRGKVDVEPGDILMVRDGTYLIGTTAIVGETDVPMLFQSHIYRLRLEDTNSLSPWVLFACLNSPIVKRQIRAKQFTQDIIDTLGKRLFEILIPIPKDKNFQKKIASEVKTIIETRSALRNRAKSITYEVIGQKDPGQATLEDIEE